MNSRQRATCATWISIDEPETIERLLKSRKWIDDDDTVHRVERAGEGNMNCTLRVCTNSKSLVVKQARPWVEKYPSIAAPVNRNDFERQFYESVATIPVLAEQMPRLIGADGELHMLVLEDLGRSLDGTALYNRTWSDRQNRTLVTSLARWLAALHQQTRTGDTDRRERHANRDLRGLNHAHIFEIPFHQPASVELDAITPGLENVARGVRENSKLLARCEHLGERYLAQGECLLHGDFFPGSWLLCEDGPKIIDPEFSCYGDPEFDVAILIGHLRMLGVPPTEATAMVLDTYERHACRQLDLQLATGWAGIEILRRLMGVAQLPVDWPLETKAQLIDDAIQWVEG